MKKPFALAAAFFGFLAIPLLSYQWPIENPVVVAAFAQNSFGGFSRGISVAGKDAAVRPIEKGELVFFSRKGGAGLPSVLGDFAVIGHEKNIRSVYGHLVLDAELAGDRKTLFEETDSLGIVGDSGITEGAQLFLAVQDLELKQTINPFLVLPSISEKTRPTIRGVTLKSGSAEVSLPAPGGVSAGQWEVFADVFDEAPVRYFRPTAAYRMSVFVNGQEAFQLAFDAIKDKDGSPRVYPSKDLSWREIYADGWKMRLGTVQLKRGVAHLEIIVRDFAGNERSLSNQFRVN